MKSLFQRIKHRLRPNLLSLAIRLGHTTDHARLKEFFSLIRPVETTHPLIRLGGNGDGGYLVPDDLDGVEICFSPGVSDVANFELEMANRGIKCFMADHSVDGPPIWNEFFDFEKKFLGPTNEGIFITLDDWVSRKASGKSDMILQMDIEGAEYGVIVDTSPSTLKKFRILVIEFHGMDGLLLGGPGYEIINLTFKKLLKFFDIVHIHPNNCYRPIRNSGFSVPPIIEFTFLRKDRISTKRYADHFPHPMDRPSIPSFEDFALPRCWYN